MIVVRICDDVMDNMERYIPVSQIKEINRDKYDGKFLIRTKNVWHTCHNGKFKIIDIEREVGAEPKQGEWIRHFDGNEWYWFCSACKEQWYEEDLYMGGCDFPHYCPNCGARMEVEHE